jgi:hypothetical protein
MSLNTLRELNYFNKVKHLRKCISIFRLKKLSYKKHDLPPEGHSPSQRALNQPVSSVCVSLSLSLGRETNKRKGNGREEEDEKKEKGRGIGRE